MWAVGRGAVWTGAGPVKNLFQIQSTCTVDLIENEWGKVTLEEAMLFLKGTEI